MFKKLFVEKMELCDPCQTRETVTVVMVTHGESEWDHRNLFTGWYNSELSLVGRQEARNAGQVLADAGFKFDVVYTSVLTRTEQTAHLILETIQEPKVPIIKSWRLNERHYGNLTGLNKDETSEKFGEEQVKLWRKSYDVPPPMMEESNPYYKEIVEDSRYKAGPSKSAFPMGESLKMTFERTVPFWECTIVPQMKALRRVLIVAHGNSLKSIIKLLDDISDDEITNFNLPQIVPFVYIIDVNVLKPVEGGSMRFLGNEKAVRKSIAQ